MTTHNSFRWLLLCLVFSCFGMGGRLQAQEKVLNLKVGYMPNSLIGQLPFLAAESGLGKGLTWQLELGGWRASPPAQYPFVFSKLHAAFSMRGYLFLRQDHAFCGFYLEPYLSFDRIQYRYKELEGRRDLRQAKSGGLGLGFQQVLLKNWTLDAGLRFGAYPNFWHESWNAKDDLRYRWNSGFGFSGFLQFSIGHTF